MLLLPLTTSCAVLPAAADPVAVSPPNISSNVPLEAAGLLEANLLYSDRSFALAADMGSILSPRFTSAALPPAGTTPAML